MVDKIYLLAPNLYFDWPYVDDSLSKKVVKFLASNIESILQDDLVIKGFDNINQNLHIHPDIAIILVCASVKPKILTKPLYVQCSYRGIRASIIQNLRDALNGIQAVAFKSTQQSLEYLSLLPIQIPQLINYDKLCKSKTMQRKRIRQDNNISKDSKLAKT
ncbi:hypothetical protein GJ496_006308 [Pomphorhynchus laevis]|nr:hypothetical protein GJ496_006308 [Pomphorhynchus laevis]